VWTCFVVIEWSVFIVYGQCPVQTCQDQHQVHHYHDQFYHETGHWWTGWWSTSSVTDLRTVLLSSVLSASLTTAWLCVRSLNTSVKYALCPSLTHSLLCSVVMACWYRSSVVWVVLTTSSCVRRGFLFIISHLTDQLTDKLLPLVLGFYSDGHKPWRTVPQTFTMRATTMTAINTFSERRYDCEFAVNLVIS